MAEWEVEPIREWRERNLGAERPTFEDAKRIVRELLADVDPSVIVEKKCPGKHGSLPGHSCMGGRAGTREKPAANFV